MFDLRATGHGSGAHALRAVRVHDRSEPDRLRFAARGDELVVGHGLPATLPYALRREKLDHVRALFLSLAHELTERVRRAAALGEWAERCQEPRPGERIVRDRGTNRLVLLRAKTL